MSMDLRLSPSNEPEAINVKDPGQLHRSSEIVRPNPGDFERRSLTPVSAESDVYVMVRRRWDEHIAFLPPLVAETKR